MKIALISDTHGGPMPEIPANVDAVIHAGDVGPDRYYDLAGKCWSSPLKWFATEFSDWAKVVGVPIYMTWGNHDRIGEQYPDKQFWRDLLPPNVQVCVDEAVSVLGRKVWFSPWSPLFGDWAWMRPDNDLQEKWDAIPSGVEILVSHTPPYRYGDRLEDGTHVGSRTLYTTLGSKPAIYLIVCGHIHCGRGEYLIDGTPTCTVQNVSCVDEAYNPVPNPVVIVDW